ncbi:MAG: hypothetical protein RSE97_03070, partial [Oscillospiraceae bacterium]
MYQKIKAYVDKNFYLYPKSEKILKLQRNMLCMMIDKYDDCRSFGMSEQKSYSLAIKVMYHCKFSPMEYNSHEREA